MNVDDPESSVPVETWLAMPMDPATKAMLQRVSAADDVVHIAVMPDVHAANDVCVGTAMATRRLVYPSAVGGDIGCGMLAIGFESDANMLQNPAHAGTILRALRERIPTRRRHRARTLPIPETIRTSDLTHPALQALAANDGALELGTLGGGNHFIELQSDSEDRLWLMIHSGSRAVGQHVKAHHLTHATHRSASLMALDADTADGQAYLADQQWARSFAHANRLAMSAQVVELFQREFKITADERLTISCDHNHVSRETHFGQTLLIHRKGAMNAADGNLGAVPGSMGTLSFHVRGLGHPRALHSAAHGAGRLLSRHTARERFTRADVRQQLTGVWFDPRLASDLREEAPKSYKDIRAVMRAQGDLVTILRTLRPLLIYKGG